MKNAQDDIKTAVIAVATSQFSWNCQVKFVQLFLAY